MHRKPLIVFCISLSFLFGFDKVAYLNKCKNDNIDACYTLAVHLTTGKNIDNQESMKEGTGYMRKACVYGEEKACDKLGENYFADKSYGAARPYLEASCNRGVKIACESVGIIYRDGHDIRQDDIRAREYFEKACALQSGDACYNVAIMYRGGFGVTKSRNNEKLFYKKGCTAGLKAGCDRFTELDNEDKGIKSGIMATIQSWF